MPKMEKSSHLDPNLDCAITIVDVSADDDGIWTCHAKSDVLVGDVVEANIKISVASPYSVTLDSPGKVS